MEIIMKKLAGLVIVLAVLILGGYYGMGVLTEDSIKKNLVAINQSNGLYADITQYNRGWFTSSAQIKWRLNIPERITKDADGVSQTTPAQNYEVDMPFNVYHGPVIFADHKIRFGMGYATALFDFLAQYSQVFDEQFAKESTKPRLDVNIFVNYLRTSTLELSVPHFKLIAKTGSGDVEWMGLDSSTTLSPDADKVKGKFTINGLITGKDTTKFNLDKVTSDYKWQQTVSGLLAGDANIDFSNVLVTEKDQKVFEMKDLSLSSSSDVRDNLFSMEFNAELKSIVANNKNYGPGEFKMALKNLDSAVLGQINQEANAMQNGTDAERQQMMLGILPQLPKLFGQGAVFEISKCNMTFPQGVVDANLTLSLPKGESSNPFELIQKAQGKAQLKMPKALVKELMQQSLVQQMQKQPEIQQALMQQLQANQTATQPALTSEQLAVMQADKQMSNIEKNGLVTLDGSDYLVEVTLEQGKFTVNGKPFEPAMLQY